MKQIKLDREDQDILDAYESGDFQSVMTDERRSLVEQAAVASILHKYVSGSLYDMTANKKHR